MTQASDVTVSNAEVRLFLRTYLDKAGDPERPMYNETAINIALAAFLAARVPDAMVVLSRPGDIVSDAVEQYNIGHNACRDAVLKGPQE